jgi:polysaccharide pyruvyl transferase WcaK-like protein
MGRKKVIVVGWYGHKNLGDEAFKASFQFLWKDFDFTFLDHVPTDVSQYDAAMIGAGSFLDQPFKNLDKIQIPLAFIGVGLTKIHLDNLPAIKRAKIVVTRDRTVRSFPTVFAPDIVFAQKLKTNRARRKVISVLLNNHFTPRAWSVEWQLRAWDWFCVEFAQALDRLIRATGCQVEFLPMCTNPFEDDRRCVGYLVDRMEQKTKVITCYEELDSKTFCQRIETSELVITQRFHGMVYSVMARTPFIAISGHDKIRDLSEQLQYKTAIPYYGFSINNLMEADASSAEIENFASYHDKALEAWKSTSDSVRAKLFG